MPLDTHESAQPSGVLSSPNSLSNFSQLALSSDSAAVSESLLMQNSAEAFICAKIKYPAWQTMFSSVRWGGNVDKRKVPCWNFCFHKSQWNNAHCSIFIFWQLLQCGPNSRNLTPSFHCCLTRQPPCFVRALQLPTFVFNVDWCIARQVVRNDETIKHFDNCIVVLSQFRTSYRTNLRQYSNGPKRGGAHENAQIPYLEFSLPTSEPENCVCLCCTRLLQ